jgi:hypothetical protein
MERIAIILGRFIGVIVAEAAPKIIPVLLREWRRGQVVVAAAGDDGEVSRLRDVGLHVDPQAETKRLER